MPSDGRLDFGTREAGSGPMEQTVTFTNLDTVDLSVLGCEGPSGPFEFVGTCPATIPAHGSVEFTVRFTPGEVGDVLGEMALGIAGWGLTGVALSARVIAHQFAFSATSLDFPNTYRGEVAHLLVTITNLLTDPITVPVAVTGVGFTIDQTSVTIPGGATADVTVQFRPPAIGVFTGALELGVAGPDHASVPLSGLGLSPMVSVAGSVDLGTVTLGATGEAMLEIHNLDPVHSFTIDQLVVDGAGFTVVMPADPVLPPGGTIAVAVRFTPTVAGTATGTLAVVLAGDPMPYAIVSLTGEGEAKPQPHSGGCDAGGAGGTSGGCLAIAMLAVMRRRTRARRAAR